MRWLTLAVPTTGMSTVGIGREVERYAAYALIVPVSSRLSRSSGSTNGPLSNIVQQRRNSLAFPQTSSFALTSQYFTGILKLAMIPLEIIAFA